MVALNNKFPPPKGLTKITAIPFKIVKIHELLSFLGLLCYYMIPDGIDLPERGSFWDDSPYHHHISSGAAEKSLSFIWNDGTTQE
jgi:hypothetical protein